MSNDVVSRIKELMSYYSINSLSLSKELGYKSSEKISRLFREKGAKPSYDIIYDISNKFEINTDWLITGRGSMLREERQPEAKQEPLVTTNADIINIPIVDISVAAGSGYINPDYIEEVDSIAMPSSMIKDGKKYLCVRVKGQSMVPSILDGGYLIVRQMERYEWESVRDNYVYIVSDTEGRAYVKRLKNRLRQHGFVVCMSDNADKQNYPNFNLYEEELNSIWYAEWYFSAKIPNIQETYYRKQGELEDRLDELTTEIKEIQKRLNENK